MAQFDAKTTTLVEFKKLHGPVMQRSSFTNKETLEVFPCLAFAPTKDAKSHVFVSFSKKLDVPTGAEFRDWLIANKDVLRVAENISKAGNTCYTLYKESSSWEDLTDCF